MEKENLITEEKIFELYGDYLLQPLFKLRADRKAHAGQSF